MNIEEEVFKKYRLNENKLVPYGFIKENGMYKYSKIFVNNNFKAEISIDNKGKILGKVIELELGEEYTNFRVENAVGEFVNTIKAEYIKILEDIANNCFERQDFIFEQTNRITRLINQKYKVSPEFLWDKFPGYGVFRNSRSNKWFGIVMNIDISKIVEDKTGEVEVLNVKLDDDIQDYIGKEGIYPGYHANKKGWVSIILDDTLTDRKIMQLINISYDISNIKGEWIVPANPKYYDVINAFNDTDTIIWKQSNNILVGDIVYLYVAQPYSAIIYKCEAVETNIPFNHKDENLTIKKVMRIKLLKRYNEKDFTFKKLNEYGITAIRGPRSVTENLSRDLNKSESKAKNK